MADDVRFIASSIKLPLFPSYSQPRSIISSWQLTQRNRFAKLPFNFNTGFNLHLVSFVSQFVKNLSFFGQNFKNRSRGAAVKRGPLFCSAALALADSESRPAPNQPKRDSGSLVEYKGDESGTVAQSKSVGTTRAAEEERVLISEVLVRNKDGEELERKDLEAEALNALKASRANSALTVREVKEDVHRIIGSGYFMSCLPVAVDTRDGIRLIFQVLSLCTHSLVLLSL